MKEFCKSRGNLEDFHKNFMEHANFYKIYRENIASSYQKLISHISYSLLHLSKIVLATCDLSVNSQK